MQFNPRIHHRRSIRLAQYDYSTPGSYFVTICVQDRMPIFGKIENGKMILSRYGYIAKHEWQKTFRIRKHIHADAFVIMPDHVHMIVNVTRRGTPLACHVTPRNNVPRGIEKPHRHFGGSIAQSLSTIIGQYKSVVTKRIYSIMKKRVPIWQRNYFERIIDSDDALYRVRKYIQNNPSRAFLDQSIHKNNEQSSDGIHK